MSQPSEGLRIALELIAKEAEEMSGSLDLGCLGLTSLPDELFGLLQTTNKTPITTNKTPIKQLTRHP